MAREVKRTILITVDLGTSSKKRFCRRGRTPRHQEGHRHAGLAMVNRRWFASRMATTSLPAEFGK
jgi:hypothetical protein